MKNVKILLLLGVMLVNMMPYINNGKIEWKAAQAEAQQYACESNAFQLLFGIYKCVNTQNESDMFYGDDSRCLKAGKCVCDICKHLFDCSGKCTNSSCPIGAGGDGVKINYEMNIETDISSPSSNWCGFCVLTAIKTPKIIDTNSGASQPFGSSTSGIDPSDYAVDYFTNVREPRITNENEMRNHGVFDSDLVSFYGRHQVSCGSSISSPIELINAMYGNHGLVVVAPLNIDEGHAMLIYKLHKDDDQPQEKAAATYYDPYGQVSHFKLDELPLGSYTKNFIVY